MTNWIVIAFFLGSSASDAASQVTYSDGFSDWYSQIHQGVPQFDDDTPLEAPTEVASRLGQSTATIVRTDGSSVPYESAIAYIHIDTAFTDEIVVVEVRRFRAVTVSWIGESILVISRDIGHVAGIEEIFSLAENRWLSQKSVHYR